MKKHLVIIIALCVFNIVWWASFLDTFSTWVFPNEAEKEYQAQLLKQEAWFQKVEDHQFFFRDGIRQRHNELYLAGSQNYDESKIIHSVKLLKQFYLLENHHLSNFEKAISARHKVFQSEESWTYKDFIVCYPGSCLFIEALESLNDGNRLAKLLKGDTSIVGGMVDYPPDMDLFPIAERPIFRYNVPLYAIIIYLFIFITPLLYMVFLMVYLPLKRYREEKRLMKTVKNKTDLHKNDPYRSHVCSSCGK